MADLPSYTEGFGGVAAAGAGLFMLISSGALSGLMPESEAAIEQPYMQSVQLEGEVKELAQHLDNNARSQKAAVSGLSDQLASKQAKIDRKLGAAKPRAEAKRRAMMPAMVSIPSGRFSMGSNDADSGEQPTHWVSVSRFKMGKYEITQAQWQAVMGSNPSRFKGANRPVEEVSWDDIQVYIRKLNSATGKRYRLPTEAEWEYAVRAGSSTKYSWGNSVGSGRANCDGCGSQWDNSKTAPVGSFSPNGYGLYDMHGNVWEWVQDCWNDSYNGAPTNGRAWLSGTCSKRIVRGGSWFNYPDFMRSAFRYRGLTASRNFYAGFRLVQD